MNQMKVVFVSNYFNHHQKPFCEEMYKKLGSDFVFISTSIMREERKKLGYAQYNNPQYVLLSYEDEEKKSDALSLISGADVVIVGDAPNEMITKRIREDKLLFRYAERPYKKEVSFIKKLFHFIKWRRRDLWKRNVYMLCASAYASRDYASVGMYKNRMYKWGYFPELKEYNIDELLSRKKSNLLLWCGRFIDWKHPEDAIYLARKLKENGYDFQLKMIGTGPMEDELKRMVKDYHLEENVYFLGSMPPEKVREHMEEAGIYLFTSDRQEGWGAVLNESMNSGCAVVASHDIGSVPFLIKNNENGLVYDSGNIEQFYDKVKYLLDNPSVQVVYGRTAYLTIVNSWNAKIAANNFVILTKACLDKKMGAISFESGPCSEAGIVSKMY